MRKIIFSILLFTPLVFAQVWGNTGSAATAAGNVSFLSPGTNGVATNVASRLQLEIWAENYTTIQDAINAASGKTLVVGPGNYTCSGLTWGASSSINVIIQQGAVIGCVFPTPDALHWVIDNRMGLVNANQINGASVPTSQYLLTSNANGQLVNTVFPLSMYLATTDASGHLINTTFPPNIAIASTDASGKIVSLPNGPIYASKYSGGTTSGIQEAITAAQTAGGGVVIAGGVSQLTASTNITISGNGITLQLEGAGLALSGGASIILSGNHNAVLGRGRIPLTPTTTAGDAIKLTGCTDCKIADLDITRTATPAVSGAGIDIASGTNPRLVVDNVRLAYHYQGIWAQVAPVASMWTHIDVEHNVSNGVQFDADNDEHFNSLLSYYNGGHGISLGKAAATTFCNGGFRVINGITYQNTGDGMHVAGASASGCNYVQLNNVEFDTDGGYELYTTYTGFVTITGSYFVNGKGVYLGAGTTEVNISGSRINASTQDGLYLSGASNINAAGLTLGNNSWNSTTYAALHIDAATANVVMPGLQIIQQWSTAGFGVQITASGGNPTGIHLNGLQMYIPATVTTPISVAAGLTDVFVDSLLPGQGGILTIATNTITPTNLVHHVATGTNALQTITVPGGFKGCLQLIPDGTWTYNATGNIVVPSGSGTAVINKTMFMCYDGSKWNPSY